MFSSKSLELNNNFESTYLFKMKYIIILQFQLNIFKNVKRVFAVGKDESKKSFYQI